MTCPPTMRVSESNGHEILSGGRRVWVNGTSGEAVARLSSFGGTAMIDVHRPLSEQRATGGECLDCSHDLKGAAAWDHFTASALRHFGVVIAEKHRPRWAKISGSVDP